MPGDEPITGRLPLMAPLLVLAGIALLSVALVLVRATGGNYRIGRTLAAAMELPLADVLAEAAAGRASGYLRTTGRISSEEEFPDEQDRPLVFRRNAIARVPPLEMDPA